jgi:cysteinyl-tRNA synthetase
MTTLPQLRLDLAEAKIQLRQAKDDYQTHKAIVEHQALLLGGKNAEERAANVGAALRADLSVRKAFDTLREAEAAVERLEAEIAGAEDERAAERLRVFDRQAAALERFAEALGRVSPGIAAAAVGVDTTEWYGR